MTPAGFENRWRGDELARATALLVDLRDVFAELDITMCLVSGTLLGATRMNSIMPWDDDIDVSVKMRHWPELLGLDGAEGPRGIRFARVMDRDLHPFMRAYRDHEDFPFIDIFVHDRVGDAVRSWGSNARQYIDIPLADWFPYSEIELNGERYACPARPEAYCDILYPDWRVVARTWDWDHRNDCLGTNKVCFAEWDYAKRQLGAPLAAST